MTPQERRARAQSLIQYRENRSLHNKYLREKEEYDRLLREEQLKQEREAQEIKNMSFLARGFSTIGDVVGNVLTGAVKGLEGIVDLGIGLVGAVGGIFSDDFQDTMRQAVSYDFAGEIVGNPLQEAMKYSYLENGGIVEQISSGIGQMLPAVIATIATYGAYGGFAAGASAAQVAAAQAAAQTASLVTLGVSAAGTSTEEAFNEGANYYAGLGYGVASGLVEVGTEKLFGGATKALTGAGVFDGITKSVAQTGWKRVALNAAEEGLEEMISEAVNPLTKAIYKGKVENFLTGEHWKDIGTAGLVGSMTALAYSGSIGYGMSKAGIGYVGKEADISDSLTEIGSLREKAINLQAEDTLDDVNERKIAETTKKNYQNIEGVLKSVSESRRAKLIEKFSLQKAFNADGTMSEQLTAWFNGSVTEGQVSGSAENGDSTPLASPKKTSYSVSLRGNEATIQSDLDRLSENRAQAYLEEHQALGENITIEQAREVVGKFSVLTSEMSEKAQAARRKFNKALNALNKISGLNTSFVITEANETFDGSLVDNERMYISADAFENDTWAETIVHEVTHLEEGSEEYAKMVDFLQSDDILVDVQTESGEVKRIPLWQKAQSAVLGKDYGFDENKIKVISEKVNAQMGLTPEEAKLYKAFLTEVAAHETQYLLGTESFIDKVIATDRSFARKMIDRIFNLKEAFAKVGDKATKAQLEMLRKAERLYLDAARKAGDMRLVKYILGRSPELEEEVDSGAQIVYNRKKTARYIPYDKVGDDVVRHIKTELKKIYNNEDGVADGIAIEHGSDVYIVDSGRENGSTTFGIRRRRRISDARLRAEFIRSTNNDAISKRFVSDEISSRVGDGLGGDSGRNMRRESRTELQTDSRESQDNQGGVLGENADNGRVNDSDIRFNLHHDEAFYETEHGKLIASAMDMATCKQMIERIYRIVNPNQYEDTPIYKNAEHWLELVGASEVAMYVDNEYLIQEKYLNNIPALIDGDIYSEEIIEAYQDGALNGGNNKKQAVRLNVSENIEGEDSRFFAPQKVDEAKKLYEVAKQKVTNANRQEVMQARARILIFAHNKGAVETLGITQTELNKSLRSWANYSSKAREMSQRFNSGVAFSNMWTGIENSSYLYNSSVSEEDFASLVGNIEGRSTEYERRYIANTMLALDTHIDYTGINFIFGANFEKGSVRGTYSDEDRTVMVRGGAGQNTVSHEIGHAIDHQWQRDVWRFVGRDSSSRTNNGLSEGRTNFDLITDEEVKQWVKNFFVFVDNISDSGSISSEYTQSKNEVFARFVAQFVEWTSQIATGRNQSFGYSGFNDKFTAAQFIEFVKILQEKAKLDMRFRAFEDSESESIKFSLKNGEQTLENIEEKYKPYAKYLFINENGNQIKLHNIVLNESSRGQGIGQAFLDDLIEYADREGKIITLTPTREYGTYERLKKWYKQNGFVENKGRHTDFRLSDTMYRLPTTSDSSIRFNLVDDPTAKPYFYELTDGQVKKLLANSTKMRVYSKVESEGIIHDILGNYMSFGDTYGVLSGKSRAEVVDMLWRGLNTAEPGRRAKVALDVAEYIIQHAVVESMYDDTSTEVYMDTIALLKPYLHKINLNGIKGEIKHRYDRDNSPYLLWGKRKGDSGLGADVIAMELDDLGFHIDAINEADIFFQIDEAYRSAVAGLKKEAKSMLDSALNAEERKQLKQEIARQVLIAFDEKGKPSKLSAFLEEYAKKAKVWREKYYEERSKNRLLNRVLDKIQRLKDIKLGTFLNASQFKNDVFKGSIERLASIKYRGNLNESGTRGILDGLAEWYVKENPMLQGVFDEDIASALLTLARGEGKLTVDELKALENVIDYFKHFVETYNKVWRGGQYVEAQPIAEKYVSIVRRNKPAKVGWLRKFFEKYETSFADPMTLVRYMDRYDDGFYTEILQELRKGAVGASVMEMEMREPLEAFYKKHKKFLKEMSTKTIEYQGTQIPLAQAMLLYMSLNRDQAILGLAKSGFTFNDGKETIRLAGFALEEDLEIEEIRVRAKEVQSALASQFTEVEKEYISIAEKLFNETCKEAKKKTDILRRGYTNALEDYYVPIRRANIAHNVDTSTFFDEMSRVSNASFNRDTVKGAKNELFIESLDAVLDRHIRAVAQYANLALAIDQYNLLYNLDIGDNPNKPTSVKTESVDMWSEGDAYFKKLISDIQGIPASKGDGVRFISRIRGSYAKYQLGANPKVWVTQLSSFAAAGNILDIDCIIKGIGVSASDVDEYCGLAKVRNTENAAALAQGVVEKTSKVGDVLMKPIGMVDRFVVKRLFGACQLQVEKNEGLKVGTKENKVKAGELLEKVILETQQNALATERSSAMRSGSEFMKALTMFSADSMKVIGRVIDAIGEVSVLKAKRNLATDPDEITSLDKKIKAANKKARRAVGSLATSAVFMALIAQCFRWLYNKDDEDDNVAVNMAVDAIGNLVGGLPLIRDAYSRLVEGYDFDNYAYSAINDMFDSVEMIFNTAGDLFSEGYDSRKIASSVKNLLYATGQVTGIPTRNIYNIFYGLTKRISPSTAYKIDDMFYKQSYRSDLAKAIERDDDAMIATITSLMLDENIGGIADSEARKELDSLVQKGFDVIPRSVSKKITYDGVEYELTPNQVKQFEKVYFVANEALASLVKMSQYKGATDEVKAKAVNFIYNVYYNLALQDFLGVDLETKSVLFAEAIDIEKLAIIVATANSLKADLDKKGVAISGTRKAKIQSYVNSLQLKAVEKYMIMGYLGYKNTKGEIQVKAYINRLSLTKTEKAKLLEYSGYAS